jgi:hypothetical protein
VDSLVVNDNVPGRLDLLQRLQLAPLVVSRRSR